MRNIAKPGADRAKLVDDQVRAKKESASRRADAFPGVAQARLSEIARLLKGAVPPDLTLMDTQQHGAAHWTLELHLAADQAGFACGSIVISADEVIHVQFGQPGQAAEADYKKSLEDFYNDEAVAMLNRMVAMK